ncbi:hypothetical protein [Nocardia bovistercoris]|uniref:Uncharacterized protein n=1 Tax=Nocardia bovistercoris TaxID=2785916 RepID=A0A931I976_9NOCA|nr:hypothetical protein [Nocardia bovistercoris]MBH0777282.1 hypothetical protein [Nocardia bovistercoris]
MSPAAEATMPATRGDYHDELVDTLFAPLRRALSPVTVDQDHDHTAPATEQTASPAAASPARPVIEPGLSVAELQARLIAAYEHNAELRARLTATEHAWAAAEREAAQLQDRNRELASDLDNALDELAGHAAHAEQERLVRVPVWSPWTASTDRGGHDR